VGKCTTKDNTGILRIIVEQQNETLVKESTSIFTLKSTSIFTLEDHIHTSILSPDPTKVQQAPINSWI
jgi:hypothetical protein